MQLYCPACSASVEDGATQCPSCPAQFSTTNGWKPGAEPVVPQFQRLKPPADARPDYFGEGFRRLTGRLRNLISASRMFRTGAILLGIAAVCLFCSKLPLFGILFFLPLADLVIAALALMIAASVPVLNGFRVPLAVLFWVGISLGIELARLPLHLSGAEGLLRPKVLVHKPLSLTPNQHIALHVDVNPFLAAAGPPLFVGADLEMGTRMSTGKLLNNQANTIDLSDFLNTRGYHSIIDGPTYPRVVARRVTANGWTRLVVQVESEPGQFTAEFRRSFPVPRPSPGAQVGFNLGFAILYDNLLRNLLGWNARVDVYGELGQFFDKAIGVAKLNGPERPPSTVAFHLERETLKPIPASTHLSDFLENLKSGVKIDRKANKVEACGMTISNMTFGGLAGGTYAAALESGAGASPVILRHITPSNAAFDYYCDEKRRLVTFISTSNRRGPVLKVLTYSQQGRLLGIQHFDMPFWLHRTSVITRGSWQRVSESEYRFSVSSPLVLEVAPQEKQDKTRYRFLEFVGAPTDSRTTR